MSEESDVLMREIREAGNYFEKTLEKLHFDIMNGQFLIFVGLIVGRSEMKKQCQCKLFFPTEAFNASCQHKCE